MNRASPFAVPIAAAGAWICAAPGTLLATRVMATVAVVAAVVVLLGWRRILVAAAALGVMLAATSTAIHLHELRSGPVAELAKHNAEADLIVRLVRDPQPIASFGGSLLLIDATVTEVLGDQPHRVSAPVLLFARGSAWRDLLPGQRLKLTGRVELPRPHDSVAAVVDVRGDPRLIGRPRWWQRAAGHARAALRRACAGLPGDPRGLLPGLVDGDTSRAPEALQDDMRATGLTHLEAVSGENLTIVLGVVMAMARSVGLRRRSRVVVSAIGVLAFVCLARPSPSVLRAAVMSAVMLVALFAGRRTSALPMLSLAVLVLVVVDPFLARSVGFVLSVLATAAIVLIAPEWTRRLERTLPSPLAVAVAVPAAAQLACTPVLLLAFGQLTPYAVPANLIAGPAVAPATILGLLGAVIASMSVTAASPFVWLGALPTAFIASVSHVFAALPGASFTLSRGASIVVAAVAATLLVGIVKRRVAGVAHEIL